MLKKISKFIVYNVIRYQHLILPINYKNLLILINLRYRIINNLLKYYINYLTLIDQDFFRKDIKRYWLSDRVVYWYIYNYFYPSCYKSNLIRSSKTIIKNLPNNLNYIEIGCGLPFINNDFSLYKKKIKSYLGLDINKLNFNFLNKILKIKKSDITNFAFKDKNYDVIIGLGGVLKYLSRIQRISFLKKIELIKKNSLNIKLLSSVSNTNRIILITI